MAGESCDNEDRTGRYRLLGSRLELRACPEVFELCDRAFESFRENGTGPPDLRIVVERSGTAMLAARSEAAGVTRFRLSSAEQAFGFVYAQAVEHAATSDPTWLCLHAAAVSRDRRAVLIAAASGHGKTTLALALASRGFSLLSDEVAPIHRDSGLVHPFPLTVGCRRGTHALLRDSAFGGAAYRPSGVLDKMLLRVADDVPGSAEPVPPHAVFLVESSPPREGGIARYRFTVEPADPQLAGDLRGIEGVVAIRTEQDGRCVVMEARRGAWIAPRVEAAFARRGVMIFEVEDLDRSRPNFDAEPRIERLGLPDGVLASFRYLRGFGLLDRLVRDHADGFAGLAAEWIERLAAVRFYRLSPGRLPSMIRAIETASFGTG